MKNAIGSRNLGSSMLVSPAGIGDHGIAKRYINDGCRCRRCQIAGRAYRRGECALDDRYPAHVSLKRSETDTWPGRP